MRPHPFLDVIFFDIGGTLGERNPATDQLAVYPSTRRLLAAVRDDLRLRIGVITTLGALTDEQGRRLLEQAGLIDFLDPHGFVSEHTAGEVAKPDVRIYWFAAQQIGAAVERCLFVGENLIEVLGAQAAGMRALLKPSPPGRELPG